jgi:hypothetical protein
MEKITVIIPIVDLSNDKDFKLFERAFESAKKQADKVIVVGPKEAVEKAEGVKHTASKWLSVINEGDTSYPSQVMLAIDSVKTDYFSVLEFDDVLTDNWFKNVGEYFNDECSGYLPLTEVVDEKTNETIAYSNEAFWATSFCEELGFLDLESLQDYLNFNTSGAVFRKADFTQVGGLKTSMKLVFWYEFLLRALYKQKKFYVVPKVGYIHTANRDGCLTDEYRNQMTEKEAEWWLDLAKKEYFFPQDRNKKYEEE